MTKRKKTTIVLCTLLIILIGWLGYSKYKEEKIKQNQAYLELYVVYQSIKVIEAYPDEVEQWFNGSKNNE